MSLVGRRVYPESQQRRPWRQKEGSRVSMDQAIKPWKRVALIFPGQGSQHVGMGERLAKVSKAAKDIFKRADEVLDMQISSLCFEGEAEELETTINQQPATFVTSIAWLAALQERWAALDRRLEPYVFAGHSMGEFTAAVAAGSLSFEQGALLVKERGMLMDQAGREFPGGMASILGPERRAGRRDLQRSRRRTATWASRPPTAKAKRHLRRPQAAQARDGTRGNGPRPQRRPTAHHHRLPFAADGEGQRGHEPLLQKLPMHDPDQPIVGNVNADCSKRSPEVYAELRDQLTMGVRWQKSVEEMKATRRRPLHRGRARERPHAACAAH